MGPRWGKRCGSKAVAYLFMFTIIFCIVILLPWGIWELHDRGAQPHVQAWFAAGVFISLAVPLSVWDVAQHLRHWSNPALQTYVQ